MGNCSFLGPKQQKPAKLNMDEEWMNIDGEEVNQYSPTGVGKQDASRPSCRTYADATKGTRKPHTHKVTVAKVVDEKMKADIKNSEVWSQVDKSDANSDEEHDRRSALVGGETQKTRAQESSPRRKNDEGSDKFAGSKETESAKTCDISASPRATKTSQNGVEKKTDVTYNLRSKTESSFLQACICSEELERLFERQRLMHLQPLPVMKDNIGMRIEVSEYGEREWRAMTEKSIAMRKGYEILAKKMGLELLRRVRGDNYCGVRSCLFQFFLRGRDVHICSTIQVVINCLALKHWNFARLFSVTDLETTKNVSRTWLKRLVEKLSAVQALNTIQEREDAAAVFFNDKNGNVELMEAGKLLMLAAAAELDKQRETNLLAMLLFARDTSMTLKDLIANHLNCIGDSGGIDQLELSLLGYALKSKIRVFHPSQYDKDDFFVVFPPSDFGELVPNDAPVLDLLAEDDRHYNILLRRKEDQVLNDHKPEGASALEN